MPVPVPVPCRRETIGSHGRALHADTLTVITANKIDLIDKTSVDCRWLGTWWRDREIERLLLVQHYACSYSDCVLLASMMEPSVHLTGVQLGAALLNLQGLKVPCHNHVASRYLYLPVLSTTRSAVRLQSAHVEF